MKLHITSIGSSSSGNAYIVTDGQTHLLLDVGLSARCIRAGLAALGIRETAVQGICITHEHVDHVKSLRAMSKACETAAVYASRGTVSSCERFDYVPAERLRYMAAQETRQIGDIRIHAFALSHDAAEPIGYRFSNGESSVAVVTDTGIVTEEIAAEIQKADKLVLEANHEESILELGPYPYELKRRILSDRGHLSNVSSGVALAQALLNRRRAQATGHDQGVQVLLAHLSTHNNTPETAALTVRNILAENELRQGEAYGLAIAPKQELAGL